jgi:hypothetical protein
MTSCALCEVLVGKGVDGESVTQAKCLETLQSTQEGKDLFGVLCQRADRKKIEKIVSDKIRGKIRRMKALKALKVLSR